MKAVLTISRLIGTTGGAQKSVVELANELNSRGHSVSIISFEVEKKNRAGLLYKLNESVDLVIVIRPHKGELGKVLSSQVLLPRFKEEILWYDKQHSVLAQLVDIFLMLKPDIVVAFLPSTFTVVTKVLEGTGLPFIIANRSDPVIDYTKKRFMPNAYDVRLRKAASTPATANLVLIDEFVSYFSAIVRKKTYVIPSPVDVASVPEVSDGKKAREKIIMTAGRLDRIKNQEILIKSFTKIALKHPDWKLHIFGEGELMKKYVELIDKHKMSRRIFLKGTTLNIDKELARSSIFVLPSITEGFSRALTEAMANGLPSIVLEQCRSNRFLLSESSGGLLSKNSVDDLSKQLEHLISKPELRKNMGQNAQNYVKKFKRKNIYDKWEKLLINLVADHRPTLDWQNKLLSKPGQINDHINHLLIKQIEFQQQEIRGQAKKIRRQSQEISDLRNSRTYRLGHSILLPARKARTLRNRNSN